MTAATIPHRTHRRIPWWLLALVVLLVALPALNAHAVRRHGRTAKSAYCWMLSCDPDEADDAYWRGTQDDGRTVHIYRLPKLPGKPVTWAIVICGAGYLATCFLSQHRRSVEQIKERCD